jgi:hypothetical protein
MEHILYFAIGLLNIAILYLVTNLYRRETGIDLFPGRESGDKVEIVSCWVGYFLTGPFGMVFAVGLGVYLYLLWRKYYKK